LEAWAGRPVETPLDEAETVADLIEHHQGKHLPPGLAEAVLGPERLTQLQAQAHALLDNTTPNPDTVGVHFKRWFEGQRAKVAAEEIAPDRADANRTTLQHFIAHVGEHTPVETISEETWRTFALWCRQQVASKTWSPAYTASVMRVSRSFIRGLWEEGLINLPRNLQSRDLTVKVRAKKKVFWTPDEFKLQVDAAHGPMRLHLLLMANAGFYQSDISDLRQDEVDWEEGTITRKRSKTEHREDTPEVTWRLWPITFQLLKKHRSNHPVLALTARSGKPWVVKSLKADGRLHKTDKIKSNYRRLVKLTGISKPLKSIRKTSANLLESHRDYARFASYFLGHAESGMKNRHYTDVPQALFDEALDWLRQQYGL
jgi:integrase